MVQFLINAGAQVDAKDREGYTPILRAFEINNVSIIQALAQAGANLNIQNPRSGQTPLINAVSKRPGRSNKNITCSWCRY